MRIAIVANDTRGGVEPYAALARHLDGAGHSVVLVAPTDFRSFVDGSGITFAGLSGGSQDDLAGAAGATERGPIASMRIVARELGTRIRTWTEETLHASEGADLLLGGVGGMVVGLSVAEKLGVPFIPAHLQHFAGSVDAVRAPDGASAQRCARPHRSHSSGCRSASSLRD